MSAQNKVIAGDYENKLVVNIGKCTSIATGIIKRLELTKSNVESYEVMDESSSTSATSAVGRGLVGAFLLGPVGALAALSAKKKGVHVVAIQFKDGKRSLIEIDEKLYKKLMTDMF